MLPVKPVPPTTGAYFPFNGGVQHKLDAHRLTLVSCALCMIKLGCDNTVPSLYLFSGHAIGKIVSPSVLKDADLNVTWIDGNIWRPSFFVGRTYFNFPRS